MAERLGLTGVQRDVIEYMSPTYGLVKLQPTPRHEEDMAKTEYTLLDQAEKATRVRESWRTFQPNFVTKWVFVLNNRSRLL